ncbi:hypothetical protein JP75_20525 [Devosia riboflavina]|uniref:Mobilization protein n=1 Tax=Devosia riboflavina TaxID=46914 RepID=A0A087LY48_9HYPH|nr:hypothetical protein [Devosia riboflavina]KFL29551.1 hypothetical protein JP75_20525 [Devosia riboflavina]
MQTDLNNQPTKPISIRLTPSERSLLEQRAGDAGISAFIRGQLFGAGRRHKAPRIPSHNSQDVGQLLALLGSSEISDSLRELAHAASIGALPVLPETEEAINDACAAVDQMRSALIVALGLKGDEE